MDDKLGKKIKDIFNERSKYIPKIPNNDTQMIIKLIEQHSSDIQQFFRNSTRIIVSRKVSSTDLDIDMPEVYCEDLEYWKLHEKYIQDYFEFTYFSIDVIFDYDMYIKKCVDGDGLLKFTITV